MRLLFIRSTYYTKDNQQGCFWLSNWFSLRCLGAVVEPLASCMVVRFRPIRPLPVLARSTSGTQFGYKQRWHQAMEMRPVSSRYTERTQESREISAWLLAVPIVEKRIGSWASRESSITVPEMKNAGVCGWKRSPERTGVQRSGTRSVQIILLEVREILLKWHTQLLHLVMCMDYYYSAPLLIAIVLFPFLFYVFLITIQIWFYIRHDFYIRLNWSRRQYWQIDQLNWSSKHFSWNS